MKNTIILLSSLFLFIACSNDTEFKGGRSYVIEFNGNRNNDSAVKVNGKYIDPKEFLLDSNRFKEKIVGPIVSDTIEIFK